MECEFNQQTIKCKTHQREIARDFALVCFELYSNIFNFTLLKLWATVCEV